MHANPKLMKISVNQFNLLPLILITTHVVITHVACSKKDFISSDTSHEERFPSASFNHFEGGVLFTDVELGLEVLWQASFKDGNAYKENLGFFVHGGLLILPNKYNTCGTARLSALPTKTDGGKLYVRFAGNDIKVFGMIHTHPDVHTRREPTPRNDYQYCYLGIHNYVMDRSRKVYSKGAPLAYFLKLASSSAICFCVLPGASRMAIS